MQGSRRFSSFRANCPDLPKSRTLKHPLQADCWCRLILRASVYRPAGGAGFCAGQRLRPGGQRLTQQIANHQRSGILSGILKRRSHLLDLVEQCIDLFLQSRKSLLCLIQIAGRH